MLCEPLFNQGAIDINPDLYGGPAVYPNKPGEGFKYARDLFEKAVFEEPFFYKFQSSVFAADCN